AEEEGTLIGQLAVTFEWSDWRNGWFWWIQSVYVRQAQRRRGVFRALFRDVEELARIDGQVIGIRLYVEHDNHVAHAVYRKLGPAIAQHALAYVRQPLLQIRIGRANHDQLREAGLELGGRVDLPGHADQRVFRRLITIGGGKRRRPLDVRVVVRAAG